MTKKRYLYTGLVVIAVLLLFLVSQYAYARYQTKLEMQQELLAQENQAALQEANIQTIREKLMTGNYDDENLKVVFLTFDDGPDSYSNEVLDILKNNDVKATFFTNGREGEEWEEIYRRYVNEGHVLANHTWSHDYSIYKNVDKFMNDVTSLHNTQTEVTGVEPLKIFRFPGGSPNANQACVDAAVNNGYNYVDWNVQFGDGLSDKITSDEAFQKMIDGIHGQSVSVVLAHAERPTKKGGREALDAVIKQLKSEGYTFMTIDPAYKLPRFTQPSGSTDGTIPDPGLVKS